MIERRQRVEAGQVSPSSPKPGGQDRNALARSLAIAFPPLDHALLSLLSGSPDCLDAQQLRSDGLCSLPFPFCITK